MRVSSSSEKDWTDVQSGPQAEQQGQGHGALVLLDLIEIAGRQAQLAGQRGLRQTVLLAQTTQAYPHEDLAHDGDSWTRQTGGKG